MLPSNHTLEPEQNLIHVLIVDDMPQVREDLRVLLQLSNDIAVVGEAGDGQEAIQLAEQFHPDVVIMDMEMPGLNGLQATKELKRRQLAHRVVILSVHSEKDDIERAIQAGADAFVQKGSSYNTLIESIYPQKS